MGGLVMPSATGFTDTWESLGFARDSDGARASGGPLHHQGYQLFGRLLNLAVHDRDVELRLGRQLDQGGLEPTGPFLLRLRPSADQSADQLLPGRRLEEDEQRLGHRAPDLARALQVDL